MPEPTRWTAANTLPSTERLAARQNQGGEVGILHSLFAHFPLLTDELSFAEPYRYYRSTYGLTWKYPNRPNSG
jgi:hypothetical protein